MKSKYNTARNVMGFVGIVGWLTFVAGLFVIVTGLFNGGQTAAIGLSVGIAVAIGGLIQVAIAQVSVAILDMADNSREALALQRAVAKGMGTAQAVSPMPTPIEAKPGAPVIDETSGLPPEERENVRIFMDEEIEKRDNRHIWNGHSFLTLGKAKAAIKSEKEHGA